MALIMKYTDGQKADKFMIVSSTLQQKFRKKLTPLQKSLGWIDLENKTGL